MVALAQAKFAFTELAGFAALRKDNVRSKTRSRHAAP
jgi:hypothetical protein